MATPNTTVDSGTDWAGIFGNVLSAAGSYFGGQSKDPEKQQGQQTQKTTAPATQPAATNYAPYLLIGGGLAALLVLVLIVKR